MNPVAWWSHHNMTSFCKTTNIHCTLSSTSFISLDLLAYHFKATSVWFEEQSQLSQDSNLDLNPEQHGIERCLIKILILDERRTYLSGENISWWLLNASQSQVPSRTLFSHVFCCLANSVNIRSTGNALICATTTCGCEKTPGWKHFLKAKLALKVNKKNWITLNSN